MKKNWGLSLLALVGLLAFAAPAALADTGKLTEGGLVPEFSAPDQDGKTVNLSDFKGKPVLVYFYPKDDTPGCTKEACSFRDEYAKFKDVGAVILGVSRQDAKSHKEFKAKHHLPFDLLTDKDGELAKSFGVKTMPMVGYHQRQSVLISPDRKLIKFYADVDPGKHTAQVLKDLQEYALHASKPAIPTKKSVQ